MNKKPAGVFILMFSSILLSGCATSSNVTSYISDPIKKEHKKIVYGPLCSSDSLTLAEGAEFRISVVVNPKDLISASTGYLVGNEESPATLVVHFKNDSHNIYQINLQRVENNILGNQHKVLLKGEPIILKEGMRFDTKPVRIVATTYENEFPITLFYELDGKLLERVFLLKREIISEEQLPT